MVAALEMQERFGSGTPTISVIPKQSRVAYRDVDVSLMRPWTDNPENRQGNDEVFRDLVDSLGQMGQLQPVVLVPSADGEGFVIADGNRRYRAATQMGWASLRAAIYSDFTEHNILDLVVNLNMFQKRWTSKDMMQTAAKYGIDEVLRRTPKRYNSIVKKMSECLTDEQFSMVAEKLSVDAYSLAVRVVNYIGWERSRIPEVLLWLARNTDGKGRGLIYLARIALRTESPPEKLERAILTNSPNLWTS